jgi:hypothetical protein
MSDEMMDWGPEDAGARIEEAAPEVRLFSVGQVGLATFLGSPAAGAVLMAINYLRTRQTDKAAWAFGLGALAVVAIVALVFVLPDDIPRAPVGIPGLVAIVLLYRHLQGPLFSQHVASGGPQASWWSAAGVGVGSGAAVLALIVGAALALPDALFGENLAFPFELSPSESAAYVLADDSGTDYLVVCFVGEEDALVASVPLPKGDEGVGPLIEIGTDESGPVLVHFHGPQIAKFLLFTEGEHTPIPEDDDRYWSEHATAGTIVCVQASGSNGGGAVKLEISLKDVVFGDGPSYAVEPMVLTLE